MATSLAYRIEHETPGHITIGVFAGPEGFTRGKAGTLTFRVAEWPDVEKRLQQAGLEQAAP